MAAKAGRRSQGLAATRSASGTQDQLVTAAFETLRADGFAQASARAIAGRAGCNPALIFYYFSSVNDLLVAALRRSSETQLSAYEETLAGIDSVEGLVSAVQERLRDDVESGHVKVLNELVGATGSDPALREAVLSLVTPWLELTERTLRRILEESGLAALVPTDQMAFAVVSLFLGMELLSGLLGGDLMAGLFASVSPLAQLFSAMTRSSNKKGKP